MTLQAKQTASVVKRNIDNLLLFEVQSTSTTDLFFSFLLCDSKTKKAVAFHCSSATDIKVLIGSIFFTSEEKTKTSK